MNPYRYWLIREALSALGDVPVDVYKAVNPLADEVVKSWSLTNGGEKLSVIFERQYGSAHQDRLRVLEAELGEVAPDGARHWALMTHVTMGKGGAYKSRTGGATCGLYDAGYRGPARPRVTDKPAPVTPAPEKPARRLTRALRKRQALIRSEREATELARIEIKRNAKDRTASVYIDGLLLLDAYLDLNRAGWRLIPSCPGSNKLRHMTYKSLGQAIRHFEKICKGVTA